MNAIYLMLIILCLAWFFGTFQIYDSGLNQTTTAGYAILATVIFAALSFLVIIFGPSKIV
jgi:hypothetical protein